MPSRSALRSRARVRVPGSDQRARARARARARRPPPSCAPPGRRARLDRRRGVEPGGPRVVGRASARSAFPWSSARRDPVRRHDGGAWRFFQSAHDAGDLLPRRAKARVLRPAGACHVTRHRRLRLPQLAQRELLQVRVKKRSGSVRPRRRPARTTKPERREPPRDPRARYAAMPRPRDARPLRPRSPARREVPTPTSPWRERPRPGRARKTTAKDICPEDHLKRPADPRRETRPPSLRRRHSRAKHKPTAPQRPCARVDLSRWHIHARVDPDGEARAARIVSSARRSRSFFFRVARSLFFRATVPRTADAHPHVDASQVARQMNRRAIRVADRGWPCPSRCVYSRALSSRLRRSERDEPGCLPRCWIEPTHGP